MELNFLENHLHIKGDINQKFDYDIQASKFESYGEYIDNGYGIFKKFTINLALKHFLGLIKICDVIESNFKIALDLQDAEECSTFLFANTYSQDLQFIMGQGGVRFTPQGEGDRKHSTTKNEQSTLIIDTEEKMRLLNYSNDKQEAGPPEAMIEQDPPNPRRSKRVQSKSTKAKDSHKDQIDSSVRPEANDEFEQRADLRS